MRLETFFEKFEQFFDAPNAVVKMRELLLGLAVRGRLVKQDPNDEPASELLKHVYAAKSGRKFCTESSEDSTASGSSCPFAIPSSWQWVGATTPAEIISDNGKKVQTKDVLPDGAYPVVDQGKVFIRGYCNDAEKVIEVKKPIILFGDHTRETKLIDFDFVVGADGVKLLQPLCIDPFYYYLALRWLPLDSRGYGRHFKLLKASMIPLPPLAEQKRIVARVDELMALCDRLEAQQQERDTRHAALARASLARFADAPTPENLTLLFHPSYAIEPADIRKSILTLAVQGKLVPNQSEPEFKPLETILAVASVNGVSKGPTANASATEILRISAGTSRVDFYVNENDFKHVDLSPDEIEKYRLAPGDLLACRFNGNLHNVGRFSYYRGESGRVQVNPDKLIRFRINTEAHYPRYVCIAMNSALTRQSIEAMCATTAGNIGLSAGKLKTVEIPLPSLAEQRRIVAKVDQLMALVDRLETELTASRAAAVNLMNAVVAELTAIGIP